jgi:hypothetical protein
MKRIVPVLGLLLLMAGNAEGQSSPVDKGSLMFSGSASFTSRGEENDDDRVFTINLNSGAGAFLLPGLMLGGNLQFWSASWRGNTLSTWGIGPKIAYFFGTDKQWFEPSAVYPMVGGAFTLTGASNGEGISGSVLNLEGGIVAMATRSVGLTLTAFYQFETMESVSANTLGVMAGFTFFVWE